MLGLGPRVCFEGLEGLGPRVHRIYKVHIVLLGAMHTLLSTGASICHTETPNPEPINANPRLKSCSGPELPREGFGWARVRGSSVLRLLYLEGFGPLGFAPLLV